MTNINAALDNAWNSIQLYCKESYAGKTPRDVQFEVYHNTYYWLDFGVAPNGNAYFVHGDHTKSKTSNDADWYYYPNRQKGYMGTYYRDLETIITNWKSIKAKLIERFNIEESIFNFIV